MSAVYPNLLDDDERVACQGCDWEGLASECGPIESIEERVSAGEIMPAGECPECGSVSHLSGQAIDAVQGRNPKRCVKCDDPIHEPQLEGSERCACCADSAHIEDGLAAVKQEAYVEGWRAAGGAA